MIKRVTLDKDQVPTEEQKEQIRKAMQMPITYDEDCPELTPAMEKAFRLAARTRNERASKVIS